VALGGVRRAASLALLAAAALLGAASPAHAVQAYGTYGGGWAGGPGDLWLRVDVDDEGVAFGVSGRVATPCGLGAIEAKDVPAAAAQPLALEGTSRSGPTVTRWRLTGEIGDYAGSGRLDATVTRRGKRACRVGGRPWAVASSYSSHQAGPPPATGSRWFGTVGGGVIALTVGSRGAEAVVSADMGFCPRRATDTFFASIDDLRGDFGSSYTGERRWVVRSGGVVRRLRLYVSGSFFSDGMSATVQIREVARRARDGRRLWACDTGSLSGYAERLPRSDS
jgi:hypothetical protein